MRITRLLVSSLALSLLLGHASALERPDVTFPVFQFPADKIPRIDGDPADWDLVPESYVIDRSQFRNEAKTPPAAGDDTLRVRIKVGWVKSLNRLYFLYEAEDDFWDFDSPGLRNDTFEIIVDGDASGGPLIDKGHKEFWTAERVGIPTAAADDRISVDAAHWAIHGVHAQNYHIFTPHVSKDWALAWGAPTWTKEMPWANAAQSFDFKHGGSGRYTLEFWITPFDYAGPEGPSRAVESVLTENKIIGLGLIVIDYDGTTPRGFWNLSPQHTAYGHASELCAFKLMPLEPALTPSLAAQWSWHVVDMDRRLVAFKDLTIGEVTAWKWDFGDGTTSTEQHPQHAYAQPGTYVVILDVTGPAGTSRRAKVWDVQLK